jgi:MoaA/NifB/PqqE/SkfB family radical SAM enzyme
MRQPVDVEPVGTSNETDGLTEIREEHLQTVFLDMAGACNLRCVYCCQSDSRFVPHDEIEDATFAEIVRRLKDYRVDTINITPSGELTFLPDWMARCQTLLDQGFRLAATSNLAKPLSNEEAALLSRFAFLCISLDTADAKALKKVRRGLDLRTLLSNLVTIRAAAIRRGASPPFVATNSLFTNASAGGFADLVALAAAVGINCVNVSPLNTFGAFDFRRFEMRGREVFRVNDPCESLSPEEAVPVARDLMEAEAAAQRSRVRFAVAPVLVQRLNAKLGRQTWNFGLAPGQTRLCTQPWTRLLIQYDANAIPCCFGHPSIGSLRGVSFCELMNGEEVRRLRRSLLTGDSLPESCRACAGELAGAPEDLRKMVESLVAGKTAVAGAG